MNAYKFPVSTETLRGRQRKKKERKKEAEKEGRMTSSQFINSMLKETDMSTKLLYLKTFISFCIVMDAIYRRGRDRREHSVPFVELTFYFSFQGEREKKREEQFTKWLLHGMLQ